MVSEPACKRVGRMALIPIVFPAALLGLLIILLPIALIQLAGYGLYWLRYRLFGVPIPPTAPPPGDETP